MTSSTATVGPSRVEFIALIAALMAMNALAIDVMLPALPDMGADLNVPDENERQFVISAYMLGFGLAQIVYGPLADRFGRRAPLFFGISLYVVTALAATFATSFEVLLALRFVQGLGAASTRVIATSIVRDRYAGRDMAEVLSLVYMVFMVMPIVAPAMGQVILLTASWHYIFVFMGGLAAAILVWAIFRLPETLHAEHRRPLTVRSVVGGFGLVVSNRTAFFYGLAGAFLFGAMFGFVISTQQIFVGIYGMGALFPLAFVAIAGSMAIASFVNSRLVKRVGMRRLSHGGLLVYIAVAAVLLVASLVGPVPLWAFTALIMLMQFVFSLIASNMNSLAMEPLGAVAGTAAAVFGFSQTIGGAIIGTIIGQQFNGTVTPNALSSLVLGVLVLGCALIAERGRLFGSGQEVAPRSPV